MQAQGLHHYRLGSRAFTLIELLVTVAVIGVLLAILVPVLGAIRDTARTTQCKNNQRQLCLALEMYKHDRKQHYPQAILDDDFPDPKDTERELWFNAVDDYFPATTQATYDVDSRDYSAYKQDPQWTSMGDVGTVAKDDNRTYKMNANFSNAANDGSVRQVKEADIRVLSQTVLLADGRAADTPSATTGAVDSVGAKRFDLSPIYVGLRHNGRANVAFADGHVETVEEDVRKTGAGYRGWYNPGAQHGLKWKLE